MIKLILLILGLILLTGTASAWVSGYAHRMPIEINNTDDNLTDYQYSFIMDTATEIAAGNMTSDNGSDCCIADSSDIFQDFWNETAFNLSDTKMWVRGLSLDNVTNTTHYIYYGKSGDTSHIDGSATFELFDDFVDSNTISSQQTTKSMVYNSTKYAMCPFITKLHDGTLFLVLFEGVQHSSPGYHNLYWMNSTDNGTTWSSKSLIVDYPNPVAAGNPSLVEYNDSGTWTIGLAYNRLPGDGNVWAKWKKSTDGGATWSAEVNISDAVYRGTYGKSIMMSNGSLLVPIYKNKGVGAMGTWAAISNDSGTTWTEHNIATGTLADCEISVIETQALDGHIIALVRNYGGIKTRTYQSNSTDYGLTWSAPAVTSITAPSNGAPTTLIRLDNGNLLASYERTNTDFRVAISTDNGSSWDTFGSYSVYYNAALPLAAGYVSSVQINSTHIFSLFYVEHNSTHADIYGNYVDISNENNVWIKTGAPTLTYTNGILRINGTDNTDNRLSSRKTFAPPHLMESRSKIDWTGVNLGQLGFGLFGTTAPGVNYINFQAYSSVSSDSYPRVGNGTCTTGSSKGNMNTYFDNEIKWKTGEGKLISSWGTVTYTTCVPTTPIPIVLGGHGYASGAFDMYVDWLFVRKYASIEPTTSLGVEESAPTANTSTIIIPANSLGMFNNWTSTTTFSNIAANESNDVTYSYYNITSGLWESYYVGYSWNANNAIGADNSVMGFFNVQTTITATVVTPSSTSLSVGWNMLFVEGTDNETIADIKSDIGANCTDVWWFNSTAGAYSNTTTDTVQPCQGFLAYITQNMTWTRSDL